jgi:hypothetical protein
VALALVAPSRASGLSIRARLRIAPGDVTPKLVTSLPPIRGFDPVPLPRVPRPRS